MNFLKVIVSGNLDLTTKGEWWIEELQSIEFQYTLLDTFDWVLMLRGAMLIEIILENRGLLTGPVRISEVELLDLIPRLSGTGRLHSFMVRNGDKKGITRLDVYTLHGDGDLTLVRHEPLRGYREEADSFWTGWIRTVSAKDMRSTVAETLLTGSADRLFLDNAEIDSVRISPDTGARQGVLRFLLALVRDARRYEESIVRDIDPEALHQYRVTLRKARSLLRLLRNALLPEQVRGIDGRIRTFMQKTNELRDLDVHLQEFSQSRPGTSAEGLAALEGLVRSRRDAAFREMSVWLTSPQYREGIEFLEVELDRWISHGNEPDAGDEGNPFIAFITAAIEGGRRKLQHQIGKLTAQSDLEELHSLRIRGKRIRYLLELLPSMEADGEMKRLLRRLRNLQSALGTVNDLGVQEAFLASLARSVGDIDIALTVGALTVSIEKERNAKIRECRKLVAELR